MTAGRYAALVSAVALGLVAIVVESVTNPTSAWGAPGAVGLWALAFAAVGFVVAGRRPDNPIGWLLLGSGIFAGLNGALRFAQTDGGPSLVTIMLEFTWMPAVAGLVTSLALLPDGRLPSPRWRAVVWFLWLAVVAMGVVLVADPLSAARPIVEVMLQITLLPPLVAVGVRFRRSRGAERQQLEWIAYAGGLVVAAALSSEILIRFLLPRWYLAATFVLSISILAVPAAIAMAILRYRLYDIDRIISRTVAYGSVTAVLIVAYVGAVFLLRLIFPGGSQLTVAASTLAVAALFNPLRRRVQQAVDRRFNRRRYDAQRVVDSFGLRLRSVVGIDDVAGQLLRVAGITMEPATASLWLRRETSWD